MRRPYRHAGAEPFKPHAIPGTIEAEDYDLGGEGVAYHDTTLGNLGGVYRQDDVDIENTAGLTTPNVGWIRNGEYLTWTATVGTSGAYTMTARVASPNSGRTAALKVDGTPPATIAVPNTGSFAAFRTVSVPVTLPAGVAHPEAHVLRRRHEHQLDRVYHSRGTPSPRRAERARTSSPSRRRPPTAARSSSR